MLLIHGTKRVRRKLGHIAEFCPFCRSVQAFRVIRVGLASHVYYLSVDAGKLQWFEGECLQCGVPQDCDIRHLRGMVSRPRDLRSLVDSTNPGLPVRYGARLEVEQRLARGEPLTPDERYYFLEEPVALLRDHIRDSSSRTRMDGPSTAGCLGTLCLPGVVAAWIPESSPVFTLALFSTALGCAGFTIHRLYTTPQRFVRTRLTPLLARTLAPLRPTREELQSLEPIVAWQSEELVRLTDTLKLGPGPGLEPSPGPLEIAELRRVALERPFLEGPSHASPIVLKRVIEVEEALGGESTFGRASGMGCVATLLIPGLVLWYALSHPDTDAYSSAAAVLFLVGTVVTLYLLSQEGKYYLRRTLIPKLAEELADLRPRTQELKAVLARLRAFKLKLGDLELSRLEAAIRRRAPSDRTPPAYLEQVAAWRLRTEPPAVAGPALQAALEAAAARLDEGLPLACLAGVYAAMPDLLDSPRAHALLSRAHAVAGDGEREQAERDLRQRCLDRLRRSGDGSRQRPYGDCLPADAEELVVSLGKQVLYCEVTDQGGLRVVCADKSEVWFGGA